MSRRGSWAVWGFAGGVLGYYVLGRAYRRARSTCPPFNRHSIRSSRRLIDAFSALWREPASLASLRSNGRLDARFATKLMLAVAGAHGSRLQDDALLRHAAQEGLSKPETESLLRGEVDSALIGEAPALYFAHHYVDKQGRPDPDLVQRLGDAYGPRTAGDLITYLRVVTMTSLAGNTIDALASRALGQPSRETTLGEELSTVGVLLFGILPLVPLLLLRAGFFRSLSRNVLFPGQP